MRAAGGSVPLPGRLPVRAVYQPIVELVGRRQVAVEALARGIAGPEGLPARLFADAAASGGVVLLDEACLRAGLRGCGTCLARPPCS